MTTEPKNSFVAFLDVLGFKEMVMKKSDENKLKLEKFFSKVLEAFEIFSHDKAELKKLIISDSIILVVEDKKVHFETLLKAIRNLQAWLAIEGIWIRGAISHGEINFDEPNKIVYGSGYIKAYLLEQKAEYPRVIIDPSLITMISANGREFLEKHSVFFEYLQKHAINARDIIDEIDKDYVYSQINLPSNILVRYQLKEDVYFVNYASKIISETLLNCHQGPLKKVFESIKKEIYSEHFQKYTWAKKYFLDSLTNFKTRYRSGNASAEFGNCFNYWIEEFSKL